MRKLLLMLAALAVAALASVGFAWLVVRALKALLEIWI